MATATQAFPDTLKSATSTTETLKLESLSCPIGKRVTARCQMRRLVTTASTVEALCPMPPLRAVRDLPRASRRLAVVSTLQSESQRTVHTRHRSCRLASFRFGHYRALDQGHLGA